MDQEVRLLVVQESDDFRHLLEDWIELHSHHYKITVCTTDSGRDGLELMHNWLPSVVLVDAHIADYDSFALVDRCRKTCIPVFVTSAEQSAEIELSAIQSGASGYFPALDDPAIVEELLVDIVHASDHCLNLH